MEEIKLNIHVRETPSEDPEAGNGTVNEFCSV